MYLVDVNGQKKFDVRWDDSSEHLRAGNPLGKISLGA